MMKSCIHFFITTFKNVSGYVQKCFSRETFLNVVMLLAQHSYDSWAFSF
jgi:hypothetical protein